MRTVASAIVPSVVAVLWALASLVHLGCGRPDGGQAAPTGKALFDQTCARCHAPDGKGDLAARAQLGVPDMTDPAWQAAHPDDIIKRTVREGSKSKKMPP